jgi:trehalose 6-phosphate synthase
VARVVVVSNRVPTPGVDAPRAGGLAVALADAIKPGDLWFGWSGAMAAATSERARIVSAKGIDYATIDLSKSDYEHFYVGYTNSLLWPLFHFRPGMVEFERSDLDAYVSVNQAFAAALEPLLKPDDLICTTTTCSCLEGAAGLGWRTAWFFLHVPFVPPSLLETAPNARSLLRELCAYDVVGFQTERHAEDFRDCLRKMIGSRPSQAGGTVNGHSVLPPVRPITDATAFIKLAVRAGRKDTKRLTDSLVGRALIIGVDRPDYTSAAERFEGFRGCCAVS